MMTGIIKVVLVPNQNAAASLLYLLLPKTELYTTIFYEKFNRSLFCNKQP